MQYDSIDGLDKKISKLIMGNDNQTDFDEASKLWDHWIEVGGNAFDNSYFMEMVQWKLFWENGTAKEKI